MSYLSSFSGQRHRHYFRERRRCKERERGMGGGSQTPTHTLRRKILRTNSPAASEFLVTFPEENADFVYWMYIEFAYRIRKRNAE
jgi:hypothetical protein